jgi:hypothetical protein
MSVRKLGILVAAAFAAALVVPVAADAQTSAPAPVAATSLSHIPVSGTTHNGKTFTGHYTVTQFVTRNGKTYAVGTLVGSIAGRHISRSNVAIPASVQQSTIPGMAKSAAVTCPILHLVLGPLDLNLLGLHVTLNQVVLDITAIPGAGNLLGNLLCSVSNLLNGTGTSGLSPQELSGLLNIVNQLLAVPTLQGL